MADEFMDIATMCRVFAVTPRTLRFYEAKDLLRPVRSGQKRLFTRSCRARLSLILQGKRFGFSLEEIRELLELYDLGDRQMTQVARARDLGRQRLAVLEAQRADLDAAIADLRSQLDVAEALLLDRTADSAVHPPGP